MKAELAAAMACRPGRGGKSSLNDAAASPRMKTATAVRQRQRWRRCERIRAQKPIGAPAGAFPTWLAPVQARVVTVTEKQDEFAQKVRAILREKGLRVEADLRNEKLGYKVRAAQLEKIPYVLVVGDKELEAGEVNVRLHGGETLGAMSLEQIAGRIQADCDEPFKQGGMNYRFS